MKYKHIYIYALTFSFLLQGCSKSGIIHGSGNIIKEERSIGYINKIAEEGSIDVIVIQDSTYSVSVESDDNVAAYVETSVSDGTLKVNFRKNFLIRFDHTKVYVRCPEFNVAEVNGSGSIATQGQFNTDNLLTLISGSGNIIISGSFNQLKATVSGSGSTMLNGQSQLLYTNICGSGNIHAFGFNTAVAECNVNGSGNTEVTAQSTLHAVIHGSGNIYYQQSPIVSKEINGSGKVIAR